MIVPNANRPTSDARIEVTRQNEAGFRQIEANQSRFKIRRV